jgi:hypothetical protein
MNSPIARSARTAVVLLVIAGAAAILLRMLRRDEERARRRARPSHGPVTQAVTPVSPAAADLGTPGENTEQRLDEALLETFPGSDPISTRIE